MQRIIEIEKPLHKAVHLLVFPPPAVVKAKKRDRQHHAHLQDPVHPVDGEEINRRINGCVKKEPETLLFQISPIGAEGPQPGIRLLSAIRSITSPHASDHMTLVWLSQLPEAPGRKERHPAKSAEAKT